LGIDQASSDLGPSNVHSDIHFRSIGHENYILLQ